MQAHEVAFFKLIEGEKQFQGLDLTVEAHVTDHRFTSLFTEEEADRASHRLAEAGYRP